MILPEEETQRIAVREYTAAGSTVYFLLTDHLGSTSLTLLAVGIPYNELR